MNDARDMAAYDTLPDQVRRALRETIRQWTAREAWQALRMGMSADHVAALITRHDRDTAAREKLYV